LIASSKLPARLDKDHLPYYFRESPDDRDEFVEQFPPEEAKERQQVSPGWPMLCFKWLTFSNLAQISVLAISRDTSKLTFAD
jgi:hypothetical protein